MLKGRTTCWTSYVSLAVLRLFLLLRLLGEVTQWTEVRTWGAASYGVAVDLLLLNAVLSIVMGGQRR